jgi:hypothetical protein
VVIRERSSDNCKVDSGMPQGAMLGPPLFTIPIDDIDIEMLLADLAVKFTQGAKEVREEKDREELKEVFNNLFAYGSQRNGGWSLTYQSGKIMHVGRNNPLYKYNINRQELTEVEEEKDIGVLVHQSLKPAKYCEKSANMAAAILRQIERNFHYTVETDAEYLSNCTSNMSSLIWNFRP